MTTQVSKSYLAKPLKSQRCISDACLYLSHSGLFTSSSLNRCPFKLQCPVSSPVTILSWFLLKLSNAPALLADGLLRKPLACLCPSMDCHYYTRFLFIHPLITSLPIMVDMPMPGWGPICGCEEPCLASWSAKEFEGFYCLQLPLKMKAIQWDHSSSNMASYPRETESSPSLLWESQIWHDVISVAAYNTYDTSVHWCLQLVMHERM
jgi:hypothetical protein